MEFWSFVVLEIWSSRAHDIRRPGDLAFLSSRDLEFWSLGV